MAIDVHDTNAGTMLREVIQLIEDGNYDQARINLSITLTDFLEPLLKPQYAPTYTGDMTESTAPYYLANYHGGYELVSRVLARARRSDGTLRTNHPDKALRDLQEAVRIWESEPTSQ